MNSKEDMNKKRKKVEIEDEIEELDMSELEEIGDDEFEDIDRKSVV